MVGVDTYMKYMNQEAAFGIKGDGAGEDWRAELGGIKGGFLSMHPG